MERAEAFDTFVAARGPALLRFAYLLTADRGRAEDLVQTALERAWLRWDRIGGLEHVEAYVRTMLLNAHRSWWRRHRGAEVVGEPPEPAGTDPMAAVLDRDEVWRLVARLPQRQRAVLVLRYYEDMSEAQIAAALGVSVGAVKSYASRAMTALRGAVDPVEVGQ